MEHNPLEDIGLSGDFFVMGLKFREFSDKQNKFHCLTHNL